MGGVEADGIHTVKLQSYSLTTSSQPLDENREKMPDFRLSRARTIDQFTREFWARLETGAASPPGTGRHRYVMKRCLTNFALSHTPLRPPRRAIQLSVLSLCGSRTLQRPTITPSRAPTSHLRLQTRQIFGWSFPTPTNEPLAGTIEGMGGPPWFFIFQVFVGLPAVLWAYKVISLTYKALFELSN